MRITALNIPTDTSSWTLFGEEFPTNTRWIEVIHFDHTDDEPRLAYFSKKNGVQILFGPYDEDVKGFIKPLTTARMTKEDWAWRYPENREYNLTFPAQD